MGLGLGGGNDKVHPTPPSSSVTSASSNPRTQQQQQEEEEQEEERRAIEDDALRQRVRELEETVRQQRSQISSLRHVAEALSLSAPAKRRHAARPVAEEILTSEWM